MPPQFLENIVVLCFERRFAKENSVICLKSNISPQNFLAGYATGRLRSATTGCKRAVSAEKQLDHWCVGILSVDCCRMKNRAL